MTLAGGETPGKETFYVKGGGAVTAEYVKGNLFRSGYWIGKGKHAPPGRHPSLRALKRAAEKHRQQSRSGGSGTVQQGETLLSLLGLTAPPKPGPHPKGRRVKPPPPKQPWWDL